METTRLSIPNISCLHCVRAIKTELENINGVLTVEGNPERKEISVEWESPASVEKIKATLRQINYPAVE
ncbi:COP-associated family protein [uncultured Desulfobacterium sp.]|uniref:COP-associated family protein n=1 Tax=uncultured Desulfobacterium sp. TaxID=201089 RepID=A0A445MRL4_9BACT|nr:COP-associated family protein [uncultured Desulfobacterium sp.]